MEPPPSSVSGGLATCLPGSEPMRALTALPPVAARTSLPILIVEDDAPLARLLASGLATESFAVEMAHDGEAAAGALARGEHALVMLDLNLPKMDGLALLKLLRSTQPLLPVLVLTGRSRTEDMVRALDHGADDCLLKPFSLLELMARIRGLLRRAAPQAAETKRPLGLVIDRAELRAERNGRLIQLTPREFHVLEFLVQNIGKPLSRAVLMREVWDMPFETNTNIVDVYMKYLRDKIDGEGEEKLIHTVRGIGYVLRNA